MSERKFEGTSRWCMASDGDRRAIVRKCFFRDGEIRLLIDFDSAIYDVTLYRLDAIRWEGTYRSVDHESSEERTCWARTWSNDEGVMMVGRWREESGAEAAWWVELYPVDHFAIDEKNR